MNSSGRQISFIANDEEIKSKSSDAQIEKIMPEEQVKEGIQNAIYRS